MLVAQQLPAVCPVLDPTPCIYEVAIQRRWRGVRALVGMRATMVTTTTGGNGRKAQAEEGESATHGRQASPLERTVDGDCSGVSLPRF